MKEINIKYLVRALTTLILTHFVSLPLFAEDFSLNNDEGVAIYYNIVSQTDKTVAVTCKGNAFNSYYDEYSGHVEIPANIKYKGSTYSVISIENDAFRACELLKSVLIPNTVTNIGDYAFAGCKSMGSIAIPNSVINIGSNAFSGCTMLEDVTIPNSVNSIGNYAFQGCKSLPIEDNLRYADTYLVEAVDKAQGSYTIKEGTKWIGRQAFEYCTSLTSLDIPNSVTNIEYAALKGCKSLERVTIPYSTTVIASEAFMGCASLKEITIPNSVTTIGSAAFLNCSSLPVENNIRYADTFLVEAVDKTQSTYTIKEGTKWIEASAFHNCRSLTEITIPSSVISIGSDAFYGCSSLPVENNIRYADTYLVEAVDKTQSYYTIKDGTRWIGNDAFYMCTSLTAIAIPNSVIRIEENAFSNCTSLTAITIPNSVTFIGSRAFYKSSSLAEVTIGNFITNIGNYAFYGCEHLYDVYNYSDLDIVKGATTHGYVAYYAKNVHSCATGIVEVEATEDKDCDINVNNNIMTIGGLASNEVVSVYTIDGKMLYRGTDSTIKVPSEGVIVVRWTNGQRKILVKSNQ